jgi:electron transfer flavoprotein beta subunit
VISLGPDVVQETIRKALSMGADRGVQLKVDKVPFDGFSVAKALADELKGGAYDLILFGKMSPDSSNGVVGTMAAEFLGLPCVTAISSLEIANGKGTAKRELEGAQEIVEFQLPAVLTVDEGLNTARYPSLKGIMAAKKKPLEVKPAQLQPPQVTVRKLELPPERKAGRIVGEGAAAVPELVKLLQTEAKVL